MAKANPFRWSTRYQDDETDLVMYPGRPWRDARFLSRDPIEEQGFILLMGDQIDDEADLANAGNLYRFVGNNPVNEFDPLGFWPSSSPFLGFLLGGIPLTHQNANARATQELGISAGDLFVINSATVDMDEGPGQQEPRNAFQHAMRNGVSRQTDTDARALANNFVRNNLSQAEDLLCNCGDPVSYLHALEFFGKALHTVQDSTSPAHNKKNGSNGKHEFRRWYGEWDLPNAAVHVLREDFDPDWYDSALNTATREMWNYFQCKSVAPAFPSDFFHYGVDTPHGTYK
jgi:RHS repeat-associated protein